MTRTDSILDEKEIISSLNRVDWDFPGATTLQSTVHSLHRFPGNFIPQIPSYLIRLLSKKGDLVLDPFCGSGTTGVEALLLGRRAWQRDVNRSSIMVANGKLAAITGPNVKDDLQKIVRESLLYSLTRRGIGESYAERDPELRRWLHEDTLLQLHTIWGLIERTDNSDSRDVLEMLFTDTLFACASTAQSLTSGGKARRHHWGWIADNVRPKSQQWHDAFRIFRDRLVHACDVTSILKPITSRRLIANSGIPTIKREDIRSLSLPDASVDLIVTSPPYLGMIDYTLANRLTYLWFGWPLIEDRELEMGARYRRNRRNAAEEYFTSIRVSCEQIARVLRPGGFCAIVIGASRKFPSATEQVLQIFSQYLQPIWGPIQRNPSRRRVSERLGTEFYESVCVFRR
jgi:DNA modification methylase